jgi:hypothetical protein
MDSVSNVRLKMVSKALLIATITLFMGPQTLLANGLQALRGKIATLLAKPAILAKIPRGNPIFSQPKPAAVGKFLPSQEKSIAMPQVQASLLAQKNQSNSHSYFQQMRQWITALFGFSNKKEVEQEAQTQVPEFTAENIKKYPQYRNEFLVQAQEQIASSNWKVIKAIGTLVENDHEAKAQVFDAVLKNFQNANPAIVRLIIRLNASRIDELIMRALTTKNNHIIDMVMDLTYKQWLYNPYAKIASWFPNRFLTPLRSRVIELVVEHIGNVLPEIIHIVYLHVDKQSKILIQQAAEKYFGKPNANEVITVARTMKKKSELTKPFFLYAQEHWEVKNDQLYDLLIKNADQISTKNFEYVYGKCKSEAQRIEIKKLAMQRFGKPPKQCIGKLFENAQSVMAFTKNTEYPSFLNECAGCPTQSSPYFFAYMNEHRALFKKCRKQLEAPEALSLLQRAYELEKQETAKGSCVFFHGRSYEWDYPMDLCKQLYNLQHPDNQLGEDQQFLRFDSSENRRWQNKNDAFFLNAVLFGNSSWDPSCSLFLALNNIDLSKSNESNQLNQSKVDTFTEEVLFKQCSIVSYYERHKNEFAYLKKLHNAANPHRIGNLLVISTRDISCIYPAYFGSNIAYMQNVALNGKPTNDVRLIIEALKKDPFAIASSNRIEFILNLSEPRMRNPHINGLKVYSLTGCDPEKRKEYEQYRDQLFAIIKAEMVADKTTASPLPA